MNAKKVMAALLAIMVMVTMMPTLAFATEEQSNAENSTSEEAVITIALGEELKSYFPSDRTSTEEKCFEFTVPKKGCYTLEYTGLITDIEKDSLINITELQRKEGNQFVDITFDSNRGSYYKTSDTTIMTLFDVLRVNGSTILQAGEIYHIKVEQKNGYQPQNIVLKWNPYAEGKFTVSGSGKALSGPEQNYCDATKFQFVASEPDNPLPLYFLPDDGYELDGVYCGNTKLQLEEISHPIIIRSYTFKDSAGQEIVIPHSDVPGGDIYFNESDYTVLPDSAVTALGLQNYTAGQGAELEGETWYRISLDQFMVKFDAATKDVKRSIVPYYIFLNDNEVMWGDDISLDIRFKQASSSSGGSTPVTPTPAPITPSPTTPTQPTQPTTTVDKTTNPDGSTTTTTTEKDPVNGTETKTEVTQGADGVTSNTEITGETDSKTNGTATETTVDKETADKVLEEAIKSEQKAEAAGATKKTTVITFEAKSLLGNTTKVEMSIPTEFAKDVLDKTDSEIKIKTVLGEVQLSQKTLEKAVTAEETDQIKISVESMAAEKLSQKIVDAVGADAQVLNFTIQAGNTSIHAFDGGKAYITLDIPKTMNPEKTEAVYVKTNGFVERVVGTLLNIGGVHKYQIAADHFSYYALVDKDTAEAAIQKTNQTITKGVKDTKVVSLKAKATSGKIKLTWKKSNSGYKLDGYQISKSMKKNAGYQRMMEKAGKTYVNTAGVKKGQTYWYKVRGYRMVDGKKVYTDWKKIQVRAK